MKIVFKSIPQHFHPTLSITALKLSAESPVRDYLAKGEWYVVRVNEKHPTPELRGIYFIFDPEDDVYIVSSDIARQMNEDHIAEFGAPWANYTG